MLNDIRNVIAHTTPKEWAEDVGCLACIVFLIGAAITLVPVLLSPSGV